MSEHKIEREAVLWAWRVLYQHEPNEVEIARLVKRVMMGAAEIAPVVKVAIAYVEGAKNHVDTVLELETNLATVTAERDNFRDAFSNSHLDKLTKELETLRRAAAAFIKAEEARDRWPCRTSEGLALAKAAGVVK